jgi:hypothetical protein
MECSPSGSSFDEQTRRFTDRTILMIITRTPFRISFFGGGTDYPDWYQEHGGAVLATSIDKYCYISCRHLRCQSPKNFGP